MSPVAEAIPSLAGLPEPEGIQNEVVTMRPEGHAAVLGASGTGKTALAVLRALYLSDASHPHAGKTLLVTYNKALLAYVNHLIPKSATDLDACTYHQFAREYLKTLGKIQPGWTVLGNHKMGLVKQALEEVRKQSDDEILKNPTGFFVPELDWMAQNGYLTEESYLQADRAGRGEDISEASRRVIFQIHQAYLRLRKDVGKHYDWADMAAAVHQTLKEDERARQYTHVVIDEGQDFSPEMLRSLALAVPKQGGSLTFFGDTSQQIYGRGTNWRTAGLEISTPIELTKNFRNSPEIAKLASAVAEMPYFQGQPDIVTASEFAAPGPKPMLVTLPDGKTEDSFVVEKAEALARKGSVAVICRRDADAVRIGEMFRNATHLHRDMPRWRPGPGVSYGNVHSAKGYEFDSVFLVGVTKGKWPERRMASAIGREQAMVMDGRLFYVAVLRARRNLVMTATRDVTPLLPERPDLWTERAEVKRTGKEPAETNGAGGAETAPAPVQSPAPVAPPETAEEPQAAVEAEAEKTQAVAEAEPEEPQAVAAPEPTQAPEAATPAPEPVEAPEASTVPEPTEEPAAEAAPEPVETTAGPEAEEEPVAMEDPVPLDEPVAAIAPEPAEDPEPAASAISEQEFFQDEAIDEARPEDEVANPPEAGPENGGDPLQGTEGPEPEWLEAEAPAEQAESVPQDEAPPEAETEPEAEVAPEPQVEEAPEPEVEETASRAPSNGYEGQQALLSDEDLDVGQDEASEDDGPDALAEAMD